MSIHQQPSSTKFYDDKWRENLASSPSITIYFLSIRAKFRKVTKEGEDQVLKSRTFSFALQLELITELLGTPTLEDMRFACEGARSHMLRRAPKPPSLTALYTLSSQATHEAVHLLCQMLVFDPVSFITLSYRCDIMCRLYRIAIYIIEISSIEYIEYKACSYRCTQLYKETALNTTASCMYILLTLVLDEYDRLLRCKCVVRGNRSAGCGCRCFSSIFDAQKKNRTPVAGIWTRVSNIYNLRR